MTDIPSSGAAPDVQRAIAAFHRHAFTALLAGETPRVADIEEAASRDALGVAGAVTWLEDHGELERDGELLVGAHGLTRRITSHTLTIGEHTLHTWCAYDAIAIPVALGAAARVTTSCPACQRSLTIDVDAGHLPETDTPVLWMPIGPCERVIDDFCPHANLFCTGEHVEGLRRGAGDPDGQILTLAQVPATALAAWADIAKLGDPGE
ncbi:MAG: organomercurial lyase [Acidimicrobiales bacterium]